MPKTLSTLLFVPLLGTTIVAAEPVWRGPRYLDNGVVRLGVDLDRGGAITYLSTAGRDDNVVNNYDRGRQIQMSFYSGPIPFTVGEKKPLPHWAHIGWNPIQSGDDFSHGSRTLDYREDPAKHEVYVRCAPMQWPLDNVPAECEFESWIRLDGPAAHVRGRLTNRRADHKQYTARHQELPAVYVNGAYYRHFSYQGAAPFTGDGLTHFDVTGGKGFPWRHATHTENWAALVRDDDWGLGVWHPGCYEFAGGFSGPTGVGGTRDAPTGYIAPVRREIIDHDAVYDYEYVLILGKLAEIRRYVVEHADQSPRRPDYRFTRDRQHWYYEHAHDAGLPIAGALDVSYDADDPQLIGPFDFWQAADVPKLYVTAAFTQEQRTARLFWRPLGEYGFSEKWAVNFDVVGDGVERTYEIHLAAHPEYRGAIAGLRLDPTEKVRAGDGARVVEISAVKR